MKTLARPLRPRFFWRGALILLPVAVLAAVGAFALRQDRILARQEAVERAQAIADALLPQIGSALALTNGSEWVDLRCFETDTAGQLLFPPSSAPVPVPQPFDVAALPAGPARLWRTAQGAEREGRALPAAVQAYQEFLDANPPAPFAAAARYGLGLLLAQDGKPAAAQMFEVLLAKNPDAVGETGLPLRPLAQWRLLEPVLLTTNPITAQEMASLAAFCSNAVFQPTPLTPYLLDRVRTGAGPPPVREEAQKWLDVWQRHEFTRWLFAAARPHWPATAGPVRPLVSVESPAAAGATPLATSNQWFFPAASNPPRETPPRLFWFRTPEEWGRTFVTASLNAASTNVGEVIFTQEDSAWLALRCADTATGHWFVCRPESEVGTIVTKLVARAKTVPDYFGVGLEVAGRNVTRSAPDLRLWHHVNWFSDHSPGGGVKVEYDNEVTTNVLASAIPAGSGTEPLKVNVYLTSPAALFEHQRARTFWFGALIAVSAGAALVGLLAAWRAFEREQRLGELKTNFVSSVSHELRAPIASVRLLAESLERGKIQEPARQREYYRFIGQECRRLSALIENVLDFARIEQGRKQYECEPTDLRALVEQTVKLMEPQAAERQVRLTAECRWPNAEGSVDGRAIQQALVNLLDNALKHSPAGESVTVGLDFIPQPPSFVLSVEDHGPGIPVAEHERIFERFHRLGSELRRETPGVGIGLSIVKHIVEAHDGRVTVRSEVGRGSRFTLELPVAAAAGGEPARGEGV